jgi:hypothetical protein
MRRVWFNLHLRKWSTQLGKGRVEHASAYRLVRCVFHVGESQRQRVILERCRSVHAWAKGEAAPLCQVPEGAVLVSYNPYRGGPRCRGSFYRKDTGADVSGAAELFFCSEGRMYAVDPW